MRKGAPHAQLCTAVAVHQNKSLKQLLESTLNDPFVETRADRKNCQSILGTLQTSSTNFLLVLPFILLLPAAEFQILLLLDLFTSPSVCENQVLFPEVWKKLGLSWGGPRQNMEEAQDLGEE